MSRRDFEEPEHTPADRLEALHQVAIAARRLLANGGAAVELFAALHELDKIERYLGLARAA